MALKNVNCGCTACILRQNKLWIWGSVEECKLRVLEKQTAPVKMFGPYGKEEFRWSLLSSICHLQDDGSNVHHDFDLKCDATFGVCSTTTSEVQSIVNSEVPFFLERLVLDDVAVLSSGREAEVWGVGAIFMWRNTTVETAVWQWRPSDWPLFCNVPHLCDTVVQTKVKAAWLVTFPPLAQPCLISLKLSSALCLVNKQPRCTLSTSVSFSYLVSVGALFCFSLFFPPCQWSCPPNLLCVSNRPLKKRGEGLHGPPGVCFQCRGLCIQ